MGPLYRIKVLDMTSVMMGPFATQALGDWGADILKVESPEGDLTRQIAPAAIPGMGAIYVNANRNKRSICLDLKKPGGREALLKLAAQCDVLAYNIRPQAMERLGLGYEAIKAVNPKIIYAGVYGFGQDGPYAKKPAYDDLIQGGAGIPSLAARASRDGQPRYAPFALADRSVGFSAIGVICAALFARERTGKGQRVDVPMFETMVNMVMGDHMAGLTFVPAMDKGGYARQISPDRRPYQTKDGYVCALIYVDKHWKNFFEAIERMDLWADDRFNTFAGRARNIDHVYAEIAEIFQTRTSKEWLKILEDADIPCMPMHDLQSMMDDPHLVATGFFQTVEHPALGTMKTMRPAMHFSETPASIDRLAPTLGEHGIEILRENGLSDEEIAMLRESGTLIVPDAPTPAI